MNDRPFAGSLSSIAPDHRARASAGDCWPTREHTLLIQAAVLDAARGAQSLDVWQTTVSLDRLDRASARLLPLLYPRIESLTAALATQVADAFERCVTRNRELVAAAAEAGAVLSAAGVPSLLLKGMALVARGFMPIGGRPMADCDVLVPASQALAARDALIAAKWRLEGRLDAALLSVRHAAPLRHPSGRQLDLHWHALAECLEESADARFWQAAVAANLEGTATRTLCAADMLLHTCTHGLRWSVIPPVRWVPDALAIIAGAGEELDWDRVAAEAERRVLSLPMSDTLRYLQQTFDAPVPLPVLERLAAMAVPSWARAEYRIKMRPRTRRRQLRFHWFQHRRLSASGSIVRDVVTLPAYVRKRWRLGDYARGAR